MREDPPKDSSSANPTFSKLPANQTFWQLLIPFLTPYLLYTGLASLFPAAAGQPWLQGLKLAVVGLTLAVFRKAYRFGAFRPRDLWIACAAAPIVTLLWVGPLCGWQALHGLPLAMPGRDPAGGFALHLMNAVLLVAVFEELLLRVYMMEWAFQADTHRAGRGLLRALMETLDERPAACARLPLSLISVAFTTILFTAGHPLSAYPSALLYFSFTNWIYRRTASLWVCILIHAWTNLLVALLVQFAGWRFLW